LAQEEVAMIDHTGIGVADVGRSAAFYDAVLRAGGTDNGAPSLREGGYPPGYYAAFVLDPDGNNIEAVSREA
jgi:catechol 2,3-dioxygenase-like lactoylglutathione lyase family enzyme